jgi:LPXTG-motif cell wall-anchored protein
LTAKLENGYRFVSWTGDVDTIDNVNAAQTAITMNDEYSITANFETGQPVNWALIGGIVGAVVIVGLVIFFVRRKKGVQKEGRGKKGTRAKRR